MEPIKVFIVEDESIVREGIRDMIPWEQYGFVFSGEASDGEVALPMVRRIRPDILITDIKMPFMDGLSLSRLVNRELPDTRIIILSGYDDFEYAQQAGFRLSGICPRFPLKTRMRRVILSWVQTGNRQVELWNRSKCLLWKMRASSEKGSGT